MSLCIMSHGRLMSGLFPSSVTLRRSDVAVGEVKHTSTRLLPPARTVLTLSH